MSSAAGAGAAAAAAAPAGVAPVPAAAVVQPQRSKVWNVESLCALLDASSLLGQLLRDRDWAMLRKILQKWSTARAEAKSATFPALVERAGNGEWMIEQRDVWVYNVAGRFRSPSPLLTFLARDTVSVAKAMALAAAAVEHPGEFTCGGPARLLRYFTLWPNGVIAESNGNVWHPNLAAAIYKSDTLVLEMMAETKDPIADENPDVSAWLPFALLSYVNGKTTTDTAVTWLAGATMFPGVSWSVKMMTACFNRINAALKSQAA